MDEMILYNIHKKFLENPDELYLAAEQLFLKSPYHAAERLFLKSPSFATLDSMTDIYTILLKTLTITGLLLETLLHYSALLSMVEFVGSCSLLGAWLNTLIGAAALKDAVEEIVHRPITAGIKGATNVINGVMLTTSVALSMLSILSLGHISWGAYFFVRFILSIESLRHAQQRLTNDDYWLEDSLNAWVKIKQNIQIKEEKLKKMKDKSDTSGNLFNAPYAERQEHLNAMKLESFLLQKDIICTMTICVQSDDNLAKQSMQSIINNMIKKYTTIDNNSDSSINQSLKNMQKLAQVTGNVDSTATDTLNAIKKQDTYPTGEKFTAQIEEAKSINNVNINNLSNILTQHQQKIQKEKKTQWHNATINSAIYGIATVGTVMCLIPIPVVQAVGVILLAALLGAYLYQYRHAIIKPFSLFFKAPHAQPSPVAVMPRP